MPKLAETDSWVKERRELLREGMSEKRKWKWSVGNHKGSIRLQVNDGKKQTRVIPFEWSKKGLGAAIPEILQIYKRFYEGNTKQLSAACEKVKASSSKTKIDYVELISKPFRKYCTTVSDATWIKSYYCPSEKIAKRKVLPVLNELVRLMELKNKPKNGEELMDKALENWKYGSRSRDISRRALQKFLNWAILRGKLSADYAPVAVEEKRYKKNTKRVGFALKDNQILQLIASEKDPRWQFAYQCMAVYGLRPEDLRYLVIKDGLKGKELWSMYEKSMGGTRGDKTKPRKLAPLYIRDGKGDIDWNIVERLDNGEELPSLGREGKASDALRTKLIRNKLWNKFRKQAEKQKEELVPYAFRHRFAKTGYARSIELELTTKDICLVMGHTKEVHEANYARFIPDGTYDKFEKQKVA